MKRREFIRGAAWSVPVVVAAVAVPLASASAVPRRPVQCIKLPNHGHGGNVSNDWWEVTYSDGSKELLDNGTVMSNKALKNLCKK